MQVLNLKKTSNTGKLRAFFDLETPKMTIRGMKLMEGQDGNLWAATPSRQYEKDGEKKYAPIVEITDQELRSKITSLARTAYLGDTSVEDQPPF